MHPSVNTSEPERVLAVDPSLRSTGYAVLERVPGGIGAPGARPRALTWGVIKNKPALLQSGCLLAINARVRELVEEYQPTAAAFEAVIFVQSYKKNCVPLIHLPFRLIKIEDVDVLFLGLSFYVR